MCPFRSVIGNSFDFSLILSRRSVSAASSRARRRSRSVSFSPAIRLRFRFESAAQRPGTDSEVSLSSIGSGPGESPRSVRSRRSASISCARRSLSSSRSLAWASSRRTLSMFSWLYTFHDFLPRRCLINVSGSILF